MVGRKTAGRCGVIPIDTEQFLLRDRLGFCDQKWDNNRNGQSDVMSLRAIHSRNRLGPASIKVASVYKNCHSIHFDPKKVRPSREGLRYLVVPKLVSSGTNLFRVPNFNSFGKRHEIRKAEIRAGGALFEASINPGWPPAKDRDEISRRQTLKIGRAQRIYFGVISFGGSHIVTENPR